MTRLFILTIAAILAYMIWKIIRIILRGPGRRHEGVDMGPTGGPSKPAETFHDVKDARFEDLKGPGEAPSDTPRP